MSNGREMCPHCPHTWHGLLCRLRGPLSDSYCNCPGAFKDRSGDSPAHVGAASSG
jgi:hypothetical protein